MPSSPPSSSALQISGQLNSGTDRNRILLATHEELVAHALEVGLVREGFADLVATCGRLGVELFVASAGLDLYVEPILQRCLGTTAPHLEVRVNRGRVTASGVEVAFPHADASCDSCGNCKGALARQARARGRTVLGIGDSVTDWCLAGEADHLFARAWLSERCAREGLAHETFEDFRVVERRVLELAGAHAATVPSPR